MIEIKETPNLDKIRVGEMICYRYYDLNLGQFVEFARGTSERIMNYYLIVLELNGKYKLHYLAKTGNVLIGPDCVESYEDPFFNQPIDYWKNDKKYQWNPF